ncbi:hypothetical protein NQ315_007286 [Exocentrus adspersus]|uniref:Adenosine deaminase domain-containing protein n=1 Tax=Exocentrus adspersus TaxID=1586481 RepID=A0AAV8WCZ4_9CUCU|nr:hypothetical protein NQ315_007286 [Exocentrus adspersus]
MSGETPIIPHDFKFLSSSQSSETRPSILPFCRSLPKVELHAHLINGSVDPVTLQELGCMETSILDYIKLASLSNNTSRALDECFDLFRIAHNATNTPQAVHLATRRVIEDFDKDNVIYLELRTTPRAEQGMTKQEYVEAIVTAIKEYQGDVLVKLILSINRSHDAKACQDSLDVILKKKKLYPDIIKGIDLSGNPKVGGFDSYIFKTARENGLYTTIHCGEVKNDGEVTDILGFKPDRIGHGNFVHPDYGGCQENWELLCEKRVPVECCLTSNVMTNTTRNYSEHHVKELISSGLPYTISTDDKGVFLTDLSREYSHLYDDHALTKEALWKVSFNSVDYSFASSAEKSLLKSKMIEWKRDNEALFK